MTPNHTHDILWGLIDKTKCKPGWRFHMVNDNDSGMRMVISVPGVDSYDESRPLRINHYFPVPFATYNEKSWRRWIFEMCRRLENHELGEWFRIGDERPFVPCHGPGEDPYTIHEYRPEVDQFTTQDGSIREGNQ